MRILYLTGNTAHPCGVSGYDRVAEYFAGGAVSRYSREALTFADRCGNFLARRVSLSRWAYGRTIGNELRVWRALRGARFDLVHVLWGERDLGVIDLICRRAGVPLVATFHEPYDSEEHPLARLPRLRNVSGAIFMSRTQRRLFDQHLSPAAPRGVILHGIDTAAFPARETPAEPAELVISCAGNQRRDFALLEQVIGRLEFERGVRFRLLVRAEVRERFRRYANVSFVSGLSDGQLAQFYRETSCFLLTLEAATANNSLLEAMSSALPVIAEDVGGTREYLTPGTGILVPKGDIDAIVRHVRDLRDIPVRRSSLGAAARARARELSWEKVAALTGEFYGAVLAATNQRAAGRRGSAAPAATAISAHPAVETRIAERPPVAAGIRPDPGFARRG